MTVSVDAITCATCGGPLVEKTLTMETLVGYSSPHGHDHDDNCRVATYYCAVKHGTKPAQRRRCAAAGCGWVGKATCSCHPGVKVDALPDLPLCAADEKLVGRIKRGAR